MSSSTHESPDRRRDNEAPQGNTTREPAQRPDSVDSAPPVQGTTTKDQLKSHPAGAAIGAVAGAAAGAVTGIAAGPVGSLAGAVVGAATGGLVGSGAMTSNSTLGPVVGGQQGAAESGAPATASSDKPAKPASR